MKLRIVLIGFMAVFVTGCGFFESTEERRQDYARYSKKPIYVGVAWPFSVKKDDLWKGLKLAKKKINRKDGINGRTLKVKRRDDKASVSRGRRVAQHFVENHRILGVIGHFNSYVSVPASRIYHFNDVLMVSPGSASPDLTRQSYDLIFRTFPTDRQLGKKLADYTTRKGYQEIVMLYPSNISGEQLADAYGERVKDRDVRIVDRQSYDPQSSKYFHQLIQKWKKYSFDAIFLAGDMPESGTFVRLAHEKGLSAPIIGGDGLDSPRLPDVAGQAAEGLVTVAPFHHDMDRPEVKSFTRQFRSNYGKVPGTWAALGYDTLRLMAESMEKAPSPAPARVAQELNKIKSWQGVTGNYSFNKQGDLENPGLIIKKMRKGQWNLIKEEHIEQVDHTGKTKPKQSTDSGTRTKNSDTGPIHEMNQNSATFKSDTNT